MKRTNQDKAKTSEDTRNQILGNSMNESVVFINKFIKQNILTAVKKFYEFILQAKNDMHAMNVAIKAPKIHA